MARGVLGNDPFRRGAASHQETREAEAAPSARGPKRPALTTSAAKTQATAKSTRERTARGEKSAPTRAIAGAAPKSADTPKRSTGAKARGATGATAPARAASGSKSTDAVKAKGPGAKAKAPTQNVETVQRASGKEAAPASALNAKSGASNVAKDRASSISNEVKSAAKNVEKSAARPQHASTAKASPSSAAKASPSSEAKRQTASATKGSALREMKQHPAIHEKASTLREETSKSASAPKAEAPHDEKPKSGSAIPPSAPLASSSQIDQGSARELDPKSPNITDASDRRSANQRREFVDAPDAHKPHLMLVTGDRDTSPSAPPMPSVSVEREALPTRALRALGFARDLATAGLQSPALMDTLKVGRGLMRGALGGLGTHLGSSVDAYGRDPGLISDLEPLTELLYTHYWRVMVQGAVHVPTGPVLLVANHSGVIPWDGPVLQQALLRERPDLNEARWLVEDQIFHAPFFGTVFNRLGALRACPENARRLLTEERPVCVFPEGAQGMGKRFSERHQLKRFGRGGFVKLALRARVPLVPVAIVGAEETSPLLARLPGSLFGLGYIPLTPTGPIPLPARWMIRFGEPLETDQLGPEDADNLPVVQRLTERTRETIQGMRQALWRERQGMFR